VSKNRFAKQAVQCAVAACAVVFLNAPADAGEPMKNEEPKAPANLIKIPMTRQATDFTCGVAALQSVLMYFGDEILEAELCKDLKADPNEGTAYKEMMRLAKEKGYSVEVFTGMKIEDLKSLIDKGKPVICLVQAWPERQVDYANDWEDGHYAVAIGHDADNIFFMDPSTLGNYTYIPTREFLTRWHDTDTKVKLEHFGMVVEKPTKPTYNPDAIKKMD